MLKLVIGDLELLSNLVPADTLQNVQLDVKDGQNLGVHSSCLFVAFGGFVARVLLKLAHQLFVERGKLETLVKNVLGELSDAVGGL